MAYYWTIVEDLPTEQIVVMRPGNLPYPPTMPKATIAATETQVQCMGEEDGK